MNIILDFIYTAITMFSMFAISVKLIRLPMQRHLVLLVISSVIVAFFNLITHRILNLNEIRPLLSLILQTVCFSLVFKVHRWYALFITFIGIITYTFILGVNIVWISFVAEISIQDLFFSEKYDLFDRIPTLLLVGLLVWFMHHRRLGFTLQFKENAWQNKWLRKRKFIIFAIMSLLIFTVAYYAVTVNSYYLIIAALCFLFTILMAVYYLYKKEMFEDA